MRLSSLAAERNTGPIAEGLETWLPRSGLVLELASGGGQHALAFARRFPSLRWQLSDPDETALRSIAEWRREGPPNLLPPLRIDVRDPLWPIGRADALVAINMVHISPWDAAIGLIAGAERLLPDGGPLILYGPWLVPGEGTAPSNIAFDEDLKRRNPAWGLRSTDRFAGEAASRGLALVEERAMPANNRMLLFRRAPA